MLHEFVTENREELIRRCRAKVEMRSNSSPTPAELEYGVPCFLDQLVDALQHHLSPNSEIGRSAARHGHDLKLQGFTVSQVVHDYGDVCQSITDLALQLNTPINVEDFRTLNRCLDDAIASAVTEYGRGNQSVLDPESARDDERLGFLAHEIRNLVGTASVAFEVLRTGNVGVGGSTGSVLNGASRRFAISSTDRSPRFACGTTFEILRSSASRNSSRSSHQRRLWTPALVDSRSTWRQETQE